MTVPVVGMTQSPASVGIAQFQLRSSVRLLTVSSSIVKIAKIIIAVATPWYTMSSGTPFWSRSAICKIGLANMKSSGSRRSSPRKYASYISAYFAHCPGSIGEIPFSCAGSSAGVSTCITASSAACASSGTCAVFPHPESSSDARSSHATHSFRISPSSFEPSIPYLPDISGKLKNS